MAHVTPVSPFVIRETPPLMPRHTFRRNKAEYEQAPWNQAHIEALYGSLRGHIIADSQWHHFPPLPQSIGRYRVYEDRYFQAVYARKPNSVFAALTTMPPVEREDDAEWTIWKQGGSYGITSLFTVTPALDGYDVVEAWMARHALGWEPHPLGLQGTAYFTDLEPGCLADAMDRLVWLEPWVIAVNQRLNQTAAETWAEAEQESSRVAAGLPANYSPDEIVPVPDEQPRTTWKRRVPVA